MMKRALSGLILLASMHASGCSSQPDQPGRTERSLSAKEVILERHQTSPHELDVNSLPTEEKAPAWIFQKIATGSRETFGLPPKPEVRDGFQYSVAIEKAENRYWIIRSGGYGGRIAVFGPSTIVAP